jgi:hypothetical protein
LMFLGISQPYRREPPPGMRRVHGELEYGEEPESEKSTWEQLVSGKP